MLMRLSRPARNLAVYQRLWAGTAAYNARREFGRLGVVRRIAPHYLWVGPLATWFFWTAISDNWKEFLSLGVWHAHIHHQDCWETVGMVFGSILPEI